jgi:hypothetical protein
MGARGRGLATAPSFLFSTVSSSSVRARSKITPGSPFEISRRRSTACSESLAEIDSALQIAGPKLIAIAKKSLVERLPRLAVQLPLS